MISLASEAKAQSVWFDEDNMWIRLYDGRQLAVPLPFFPRLLHATPEQRNRFEMSGGGSGLHWDELDEDISVTELLMGYGDQTVTSRKSSA